MLFNKKVRLLVLAISVFISATASAVETMGVRSSRSITYNSSTTLDKTSKDVLLNQADIDIFPALSEQGFRAESTVMAVHIETISVHNAGEITVYDASTELISDFNYDGFYHRFSTAIDIDTVYDTAYVYVKLYLSYEGGPWNHYATSDSYHIHGDSELDSFIIETELADGFPPGYYDVRIEVYDGDYNEWLLSYGPYDDASLSALPLEDSYYDDNSVYYPVSTEIVVAGHGHGAMGWWLLMIAAVLLLCRKLTGYEKNAKT